MALVTARRSQRYARAQHHYLIEPYRLQPAHQGDAPALRGDSGSDGNVPAEAHGDIAISTRMAVPVRRFSTSASISSTKAEAARAIDVFQSDAQRRPRMVICRGR